MNHIRTKTAIFILFLLIFNLKLFGETTDTTPAPYTQEEFPQFLHDLRRFEIITLGSMPFVTMDAAIVYNGYKFFTHKSDTFNPLATADYKPEEMKSIIITSLCVSAGIGLSDYIIRLVKRNRTLAKTRQENTGISIKEDPEATKIELPQKTETDTE
ncbi:MAG: hypothetical protein IK102_10625 [Treponema sp.]|nr:hypothetical protein [Treponema sp.]